MLDLKFIRQNKDLLKSVIELRGVEFDVDAFFQLDEKRRKLLSEGGELKNKKNNASDEIGKLVSKGIDAKEKIAEMKMLSQKIDEIDKEVEQLDQKFTNLVLLIPNIPHSSVPKGPDKSFNKVVREKGKIKTYKFKLRNHLELGNALGILDFQRAAKIAGGGFALYKGIGAQIERALINLMLDLHTKKHGYIEIFPPFLANRASMTATGQVPKLEEDMYKLKDDDYFLIPTAEVPLTNLHRDEVFEEDQLPLYYTAYTACFRREAGSYGKQTQGLIRVHQFDKVELLKFVTPETSYDELEKLVKDAEDVINLLELPYRVVMLSTGDLGFAAAKCYDIELWAPGAGAYLEVSSCSNFEDFQARRANIRFKRRAQSASLDFARDRQRTTEYVHTLNGSGVALARLVVAILENYQNEDGSVNIPRALWKYLGNKKKILPPAK